MNEPTAQNEPTMQGQTNLPASSVEAPAGADALASTSAPAIDRFGFGLMRLPQKDGAIDIPQVCDMVDRFIEAGGTYFDTAWAYTGSEEAIRQALVERYPRESFKLATKNAAWINCKTQEEAESRLQVSLDRCGVSYFDYYLLHNLGEGRSACFDDFDLWNFVARKKEEGVLRQVGFSFHSTPEELEAILQAHPEMDFVQLQVNYADWENPAVQSRACMEVARAHNMPVIVMEPVKGGMLANPPEAVQQVFHEADVAATPASWALRFTLGLEGVFMVLSGMSDMTQMEDNLATVARGPLTVAERTVLDRACEELARIPLVPCTVCDYCASVCPQNIGISGTFTALNYLTLYDDKARATSQEGWLVGGHGKARADACIECGLCEAACPQHITIRQELARAAESFC